MPKPHKVEAVRKLKDAFVDSDAALLAEFQGLKVVEIKELRTALSDSGTTFKVVKNTLTRIAAKEAGLEDLLPFLQGSTAIAFIKGDPVLAAKSIDEISKKYPALVVKGGLMNGKVFGADQAQALAKLRPREELLSQLAGLLQSPIQKLAILLGAPIRSAGYALGAYLEKIRAEAPAVPAEDAATEAPRTDTGPTNVSPDVSGAGESPPPSASSAPSDETQPETETQQTEDQEKEIGGTENG